MTSWGYSQETVVGVCDRLPKSLTDCTYTIYRLTKNAIPYLRPDRPFNQTLFQIRLKISVYILLLGTILHPLPKNTYPIQD